MTNCALNSNFEIHQLKFTGAAAAVAKQILTATYFLQTAITSFRYTIRLCLYVHYWRLSVSLNYLIKALRTVLRSSLVLLLQGRGAGEVRSVVGDGYLWARSASEAPLSSAAAAAVRFMNAAAQIAAAADTDQCICAAAAAAVAGGRLRIALIRREFGGVWRSFVVCNARSLIRRPGVATPGHLDCRVTHGRRTAAGAARRGRGTTRRYRPVRLGQQQFRWSQFSRA